MQLCLNKELYNFAEWCVCKWRNNEKQFIPSNSQTYIHTYIHTYIYYLLRQVGLRQPKGWCGPADNLIKKKQLYLYKILNKIDKLIN